MYLRKKAFCVLTTPKRCLLSIHQSGKHLSPPQQQSNTASKPVSNRSTLTMQTSTNASLFQTSHSEALGVYRSRKAVHTSGLVTTTTTTTTSSSAARYGYPIHLHPDFATAVIANPDDLAVEGSGADGGRYRILSLRVQDGHVWTSEAGGVVRQVDAETGTTVALYKGAKAPVPSFGFLTTEQGGKTVGDGIVGSSHSGVSRCIAGGEQSGHDYSGSSDAECNGRLYQVR